ncbi:hypothetical protein BDR07DRAFT_389675 [Suillus spraguei]|nr:hypothetical protein BDR07DRAFT_389675 [Suillus spraguei]
MQFVGVLGVSSRRTITNALMLCLYPIGVYLTIFLTPFMSYCTTWLNLLLLINQSYVKRCQSYIMSRHKCFRHLFTVGSCDRWRLCPHQSVVADIKMSTGALSHLGSQLTVSLLGRVRRGIFTSVVAFNRLALRPLSGVGWYRC